MASFDNANRAGWTRTKQCSRSRVKRSRAKHAELNEAQNSRVYDVINKISVAIEQQEIGRRNP